MKNDWILFGRLSGRQFSAWPYLGDLALKEFIYNYEEFKNAINLQGPLHHVGERKCIDKQGIFYEIIFRIYGVSKKDGHIVIFEARHRTTIMEEKQHQKQYVNMIEKWAKPIHSTEGELIE